MDSKDLQTATGTIRSYKRWTQLIGGVFFTLVIAGVGFWMIMSDSQTAHGTPLAVYAPYAFLVASIVLIISIIFFVRQGKVFSAQNNAAFGKVSYQDTTGDAVRMAPLVDASQGSADLSAQHPLATLTPVMANGLHEVGGAGQTTLHNQENAVILTEQYLVAVQIPVTEGSQEGLGGLAGLAGSLMPGAGADTLNTVMTGLNSGATAGAALKIIGESTVADIAQKYYSFVVQRSDITSIHKTMLGSIDVKTNTGKKYSWSCMDRDSTQHFLEVAVQQGLPTSS